MAAPATLIWFREDLRLHDNPALAHAVAQGGPLAALFVLDETPEGGRPPGGARRWWLAGSLRALQDDLAARGVRLLLGRGPAQRVLPEIAARLGIGLVVMNHRSGPAESATDAAIAAALRADGREARRFNGHLLHAPGTVLTASGTLPRTFAAFLRAGLARPLAGGLSTPPERLDALVHDLPGEALDALGLEPSHPDWAGGLRARWVRGEAAGRARLAAFVREGLNGYAAGRDLLSGAHASDLSPYLASGALSPRRVLDAVRTAREAGDCTDADAEKFIAELYWRDYAHHLLAAFPHMPERNLDESFDAFPWRAPGAELIAWQKGQTGYPAVDAAMRQLWRTGTLPNRARMVVASFLTKHLLIHWRHGEAWFWDCLVDADVASNPMNWQWTAGCGVDAAPYFRIFNPVLQGEKFDPSGDYVRAFVPELARLPAALIHQPWKARPAALAEAGIVPGTTYPRPLIAHDQARARALAAYQTTRNK